MRFVLPGISAPRHVRCRETAGQACFRSASLRWPVSNPRVSTATKARRGTVRPGREPRRPAATRRARAKRTEPRDYLALAADYAEGVREGRIVACQPIRWAVERQDRDRQRAASDPRWPYVWSPEHVIDYCAFAETLMHVEGAWKTANITLEPWQIFKTACCLAGGIGAICDDGGSPIGMRNSRARARRVCARRSGCLLLPQGR